MLPEAEEVDIELKPEDLRIEVCRAGGPGGQGVNTTDSAVQIHPHPDRHDRALPGRAQPAEEQGEGAQDHARALARGEAARRGGEIFRRIARARSAPAAARKKSAPTIFRRTAITDHRIGLTLYNLDRFMEGESEEMIQRCRRPIWQERLKESAR